MTIDSGKTGFDRGLEPFKILGLRQLGDEKQFLMSWKGSTKTDFVPASLAKQMCLKVVVEFYEYMLFGVET